MAIYYVGPGGNNGNNGQSWANRKLTLNGAEDIPVAAGDTVYVGPGTYREQLTVDVAGTLANPIVYIADVAGGNTDGIGGAVRITGSDNDQTATRSNCINMPNARSYRTFRGFLMDTTTGSQVNLSASSDGLVIEDCEFKANNTTVAAVIINGTGAGCIVRRSTFIHTKGPGVQLTHSSTVNGAGHIIENCVFASIQTASGIAVRVDRIGGITVKNCNFLGCQDGVRVVTALAGGQTVTVNNCIFQSCNVAVRATATGELVEDYNTFFSNGTDRNTVSTGSNSVNYPALFEPAISRAGYRFPHSPFAPSEWSQFRRLTGTGMPTDDFFGFTRPTTAGKRSWGAVQYQDVIRDTEQTRNSSTASLKLADAGRHSIFVPVTNVSTTISCYTYRAGNYAGTLPQMIIRQPGQSDITITDTGDSGQWNQLTHTFTPAASPPYVVVVLVSNNTSTTIPYNVYFEDLTVS